VIQIIYEIDTSNQFEIKWDVKGSERILQNVINLINTFKYEVAYDRTLGINPDLVDMPANEAGIRFANEIVSLIVDREPRAEVKTVDYLGADINGAIALKVVIEI
jgi:hypothetical protein